ncbi:MAG: AI-2E family transporter [Phycisphaerae bacterium]|nr:AI-2E family transporter [Phycisphaerae bacterium]
MAIVAAVSWIGFLLIGLPLALSLALLAGFSEIVPTIGPAVAFLIAFLFALSQGTYYAVGVAVIYAVNQLIESYVLPPIVMKKAVKVPPIVTLFTVVLWSKVFGILGLLLALPIDLTIWSFFKHLLVKDDRE